MFTRLNNHIDVTIFDISEMGFAEKSGLLDQVLALYEDSQHSLTNRDEKTRLVLPAVFSAQNCDYRSAGTCARKGLFEDILGYNNNFVKDFGESNIITKYDDLNYRFTPNEKGGSRRKIAKEEDSIVVTESKTKTLLDRYHSKMLRKTGKTVTLSEKYTGRCLTISSLAEGYAPKKSFDVFKGFDRVMFIDTVYTLSELQTAFSQWYYLFRLSSNRFGYVGDYNFNKFNVYPDTIYNLKKLYTKHRVTETETWKRSESMSDCLTEHVINRLKFNSLHEDNEKQINNEEQVFIPVRYILFLEKSANLFQSHDSILMEKHTVNNPQFFVSKNTNYNSVGNPAYITGDMSIKDRKLIKTQSNTLGNITTGNYVLKTTLTSIPVGLTNRLLKSKLKDVTRFSTEDMSPFYFFTPEEEKEILKPNTADFYYCIRFDGRVDLSYYTNHIHLMLINRFANTAVKDELSVKDIIGNPTLLYNPMPDIKQLYKDLETRQDYLSKKFNNSTVTLLSKEMFAYEKAAFFFLYLIRKIGLTVINARHSNGNDDIEGQLLQPLRKNGGHFTSDLLYRCTGGDFYLLDMRAYVESYALETLFKKALELSTEALLADIEEAINKATVLIDKDRKDILKVQKIGELLYNKSKEDGILWFHRNIWDHILPTFRKLYQSFAADKANIYYIYSKDNSPELLPELLRSMYIRDYLSSLESVFRVFHGMLSVPVESPIVGSIAFALIDPKAHESMQYAYDHYYGGNKKYTKFIISVLKDNEGLKKDNLKDFVDLLIRDFDRDYISNRK